VVELPPGWLQSAGRIIERLDALFEIGRDAGTNRAGLGEGEQRAHDLVAGWMHEAGLAVTVDRAGNLWGRAAGADPSLPEVWSGSHLDTPPDGGRFDGALGVVTALEASAAIRASGGARRTIAVVAFRLEEGPRFGRGVFGSRALFGELEADEADLVDAEGVTLGEAFTALGLGETLPSGAILDGAPACFVEAHIEQGPSLAAQGATLGVVTSIAGMAGIEIVFAGRRGHAGTVPMDLRSDALGAAAGFVRRVHDAARSLPGAVATVGRLDVSPGATNTIPGRVELFADLRAPDSDRLDALVAAASSAARHAADGASCQVEVVPRWRYEPVAMDPGPSDALRRAIAGAGLEPVELPSGAGHDAAITAEAGVPSGMLFVRSDAEGLSHAPEEATGADAVAAAVGVLEAALRELAA
jgi:allantoate deiminase